MNALKHYLASVAISAFALLLALLGIQRQQNKNLQREQQHEKARADNLNNYLQKQNVAQEKARNERAHAEQSITNNRRDYFEG